MYISIFAIFISTLFCGYNCYKILSEDDCSELAELLQMIKSFDFIIKAFNISKESLYQETLTEYYKMNISEKLLNIYIKQDFYLGFILYAIECNTINPAYAIAKKNYDSSKNNTILGLQTFSYICAFLSYISLLYYVYANFTKLNRLYERIPIPQAEQLNPTRT